MHRLLRAQQEGVARVRLLLHQSAKQQQQQQQQHVNNHEQLADRALTLHNRHRHHRQHHTSITLPLLVAQSRLLASSVDVHVANLLLHNANRKQAALHIRSLAAADTAGAAAQLDLDAVVWHAQVVRFDGEKHNNSSNSNWRAEQVASSTQLLALFELRRQRQHADLVWRGGVVRQSERIRRRSAAQRPGAQATLRIRRRRWQPVRLASTGSKRKRTSRRGRRRRGRQQQRPESGRVRAAGGLQAAGEARRGRGAHRRGGRGGRVQAAMQTLQIREGHQRVEGERHWRDKGKGFS